MTTFLLVLYGLLLVEVHVVLHWQRDRGRRLQARLVDVETRLAKLEPPRA